MNNYDKNIENFTHKLIKEAGLDSPSPLLLDNVMNNIALNRSTVNIYKPLISLKTWYLILALILFSTTIVLTLPIKSTSYLSNWNFNINFSVTDFIPSISLSTSIIYVVGFIILFLIQTFHLRKFINRNYQI